MEEQQLRNELEQAAESVAATLAANEDRIVFAESCTVGMIAAAIGGVPGISQYFCGSAVTYRIPTKISWLDVAPKTLEIHTAESQATTDEMAANVLMKTSEADWALAITGHLGPDVDNQLDGRCFVSLVHRQQGLVKNQMVRLKTNHRKTRQLEAAWLALQFLIGEIPRTNQ